MGLVYGCRKDRGKEGRKEGRGRESQIIVVLDGLSGSNIRYSKWRVMTMHGCILSGDAFTVWLEGQLDVRNHINHNTFNNMSLTSAA